MERGKKEKQKIILHLMVDKGEGMKDLLSRDSPLLNTGLNCREDVSSDQATVTGCGYTARTYQQTTTTIKKKNPFSFPLTQN